MSIIPTPSNERTHKPLPAAFNPCDTNTPLPTKGLTDRHISDLSKQQWMAQVLAQAEKSGFRTTPVFPSKKTKPFAAQQDYKSPSDYQNADHIGLVVDDTILLDYDANKTEAINIISLEALANRLGLDVMPESFQTNLEGTSLHWLFALPKGVATNTLKGSNDGGWEKHIDIKTGNQLCHVKHVKTRPNGIPDKNVLPVAPQALIDALAKPKPKEKTDLIPTKQRETPVLIKRVESVLDAIPANCTRETWRNVIWAVASLDLSCGQHMLAAWSSTSPEDWINGGEEELEKIYSGFDPLGRITFASAEYWAKQNGWIDPDNLIGETTFEGKGGDIENGQLFAAKYRNKLIHLSQGGWLEFDPVMGWLYASQETVMEHAKEVVVDMRNILSEKIRKSDDGNSKQMLSHIKAAQRVKGLKDMIEMAQSENGMTMDTSLFDANPYLLGVQNGILDLRAHVLLPTTPDLLISKRAKVHFDSSADCPLFKEALAQWQPDVEIQEFIQRLFGVCLSGKPHIQQLIFFYGAGANGKSVLIELVSSMLGEYSTPIQTEMLMRQQRSSQSASPDILKLKGARIAFCNELSEGARIDEGRVKQLTGGDTLTGRALYKSDVTFQPSHNLIMVGNHQPSITDTSEGMWRRMLLIPFDHIIPENERDPLLLTKLQEESPGILNWMLEGLADYRKHGLDIPPTIAQATDAYRNDEDILGAFIDERLFRKHDRKVSTSVAYNDYANWCAQSGHGKLSKSKFTRRLKDKGIDRDGGRRNFKGIELIPFNATLH